MGHLNLTWDSATSENLASPMDSVIKARKRL